ncbi:hypothetical protein ABDX87_09575 [Pseudomonas abietaniphila]|uniref:hypothetical protein n=1 Tax=Pseudomonas abietaniphila TaxID=89065 RepID=UPI003217BE01
MSNRIGALPAATEEIGESLFYNPALFQHLGNLNQTNPNAVSVMLKLVGEIDDRGAVQLDIAAVAQHCEITPQDVTKAIADLAGAGFIGAVQSSTESGEPIACTVNPTLARAEVPDELREPSVKRW